MNDDWFFVWAGVHTENSFVITNDQLRDHIFKISEEDVISNNLSRWISNYIVGYELIDNTFYLHYPEPISVKIQKIYG